VEATKPAWGRQVPRQVHGGTKALVIIEKVPKKKVTVKKRFRTLIHASAVLCGVDRVVVLDETD
jgi:hypothetical protein